MDKRRFNKLKLKFTDESGKYIFPVPVCEMKEADLKDYIEYLELKFQKASFYVDFNKYSFKSLKQESKCLYKLIDTLNFIKVNRPDFNLTEKQKKLFLFKGGVKIG